MSSEIDPLLAARAFIGMVVHHRLLHEIFDVPLHCPHKEIVDTYVELFLNGLRHPSTFKDTEAVACPIIIKRHLIVTLGIVLVVAVVALVALRLSSAAKSDLGKNRILTVGTMNPIKQDSQRPVDVHRRPYPQPTREYLSRVDGYTQDHG